MPRPALSARLFKGNIRDRKRLAYDTYMSEGSKIATTACKYCANIQGGNNRTKDYFHKLCVVPLHDDGDFNPTSKCAACQLQGHKCEGLECKFVPSSQHLRAHSEQDLGPPVRPNQNDTPPMDEYLEDEADSNGGNGGSEGGGAGGRNVAEPVGGLYVRGINLRRFNVVFNDYVDPRPMKGMVEDAADDIGTMDVALQAMEEENDLYEQRINRRTATNTSWIAELQRRNVENQAKLERVAQNRVKIEKAKQLGKQFKGSVVDVDVISDDEEFLSPPNREEKGKGVAKIEDREETPSRIVYSTNDGEGSPSEVLSKKRKAVSKGPSGEPKRKKFGSSGVVDNGEGPKSPRQISSNRRGAADDDDGEQIYFDDYGELEYYNMDEEA